MRVFMYRLELQDFLFYAQESISGTLTPKWLHATAINHALIYKMNLFPERQPYFMTTSGGRNVPEYSSSLIPGADFYATPATIEIPLRARLATFLVKGDREGYGFASGEGGEVLRVSRVTMLAPGTTFMGFILCKEDYSFPEYIRLGRFRSMVRMSLRDAENLVSNVEGISSHPVDPLVTTTTRGVLVPMLPYPLVNRAFVKRCIMADFDREHYYVAMPDAW